jgi:hypothetical protein
MADLIVSADDLAKSFDKLTAALPEAGILLAHSSLCLITGISMFKPGSSA